MRNLRCALLLSGLVCAAASNVYAQALEIGASVGTSCKGSDGSFCSDTHSALRTMGPYAAVWFVDQLQIGGRGAWLRQPDLDGVLFPEQFAFAITERRRMIAEAEVTWHFRPGKRVRPYLGGGLGGYRDRELVTCEPVGCEARLTRIGRRAGEHRQSHSTRTFIAGLSVDVLPRVRVHDGWKYHNPFKDELALSEVFVAVGYRFWSP
ncbi:MAG: hypothetical protein IT178_05845 [Acidobacteria bacterium]|nr:hypothetical protein [Acidobacteriota bacterium]